MYDLIIIGSGPAGMTAGIYAQRAGLDALVIERNFMSGGQIIDTYEVDNYPGLPNINGFDLNILEINDDSIVIRNDYQQRTIYAAPDSMIPEEFRKKM